LDGSLSGRKDGKEDSLEKGDMGNLAGNIDEGKLDSKHR
jgi:hypothetical protein